MAENISPFLTRTALLLGQEAVQRLQDKTVVQAGLGGVGGSCAEALCRSGLGAMHLIDGDYVEPSNLNRQLFAAKSTLGLPKTEAARRRGRIRLPHQRTFWTDHPGECRFTAASLRLYHRCHRRYPREAGSYRDRPQAERTHPVLHGGGEPSGRRSLFRGGSVFHTGLPLGSAYAAGTA